MSRDILKEIERRVLILDGAMGTNIQLREAELTLDDFEGHEGCNEVLVRSRPDVIRAIHESFLGVGCDAVETNTFGGNRVTLGRDFGLADDAYELNYKAAALAREACDRYAAREGGDGETRGRGDRADSPFPSSLGHSCHGRPRFVIGSMGPGNKLITLGQVAFDELLAAYCEQARALIEGGADALLIETCQDILQAKVAIIASLDAMEQLGRRVPLMVQVTIETTGTMLLGTEISAALTTLEAFPIDVIGLNCATGPKEMAEHIRYLSEHARCRISCVPNAGLPENVGGRAHYHLSPQELADWLERFVAELGVNIVGGCCGTTPEHLAVVVERLAGRAPAERRPVSEPALSSLYQSVPLRQEPRPLILGERTNTTGSRKFKKLIGEEDWDGIVQMGREQEREGAHVLDVSVAYVGRDEVRDMCETVRRFNQQVSVPLSIDSTEAPVIEAALKLIGGKPIINSINFEDGMKRIEAVVPLAKRYGAALIGLAIDEQGQARTADWKFRVIERMYRVCTEDYGVPPGDLVFDPLTFPIATGQLETRPDGVELLKAIRRVKQELPGCFTIVGLSNISFGLPPEARHVLNSVFLDHALEAGLDAAILHAAKIVPLNQIPREERELAERLIFETGSTQAVMDAVEFYQRAGKTAVKVKKERGATVEARLKHAIIDGQREHLIEDLDLALKTYAPLEIINQILLDGMKVVGDLFGSGQMQLPFVLQSAEVMKAAVGYLEPFMEKATGASKGKIVLATVKGDVHDIGKNLVDIILTNNGYTTYNLGIKVPIEQILASAQEHEVDAIGLSGLLVKSTGVMKTDLEELRRRNVTIPVLCGGAALTRRFVEEDLRAVYAPGDVYYGKDAFTGLRIMDELCSVGVRGQGSGVREASGRVGERARAEPPRPAVAARQGVRSDQLQRVQGDRRKAVTTNVTAVREVEAPRPPFLGTRVETDIPLDEIYRFINKRALFGTQWQFRKGGVKPAEYERQMREVAYPAFERLKRLCKEERLLEPAVVYGFFPCAREGDDLVVFDPDADGERVRFRFPRQTGRERRCLSDYFRSANGAPTAPADAESRAAHPVGAASRAAPSAEAPALHQAGPARLGGPTDVVAFHVVTMGRRIGERARELFEANKYQDYLFLHGFGVEATEALAEYWHREIRRQWGIAGDDADDIDKLFHLHFRGCRYSFGYPACPNLEDQKLLFELLQPERIGVVLTETYQLDPEQSTSAIIVHHPEAKYFNVD